MNFHDSRRRYENLKGIRIFNRRPKCQKLDWNKFSGEGDDSRMFEDEIIRLRCFGKCGSMINKLLTNNTNLKNFKFGEQKERIIDVMGGKGSELCYSKLTFDNEDDEKHCLNLMREYVKYDAENRPMGLIRKINFPCAIFVTPNHGTRTRGALFC